MNVYGPEAQDNNPYSYIIRNESNSKEMREEQ